MHYELMRTGIVMMERLSRSEFQFCSSGNDNGEYASIAKYTRLNNNDAVRQLTVGRVTSCNYIHVWISLSLSLSQPQAGWQQLFCCLPSW